mgnify:CR=1 FL=1
MLLEVGGLKTALVALSLSVSLFPSISLANKKAITNLLDDSSLDLLDPADSAPIAVSPFLLYPTPLRLADVTNAVSRLPSLANAPVKLSPGGRPLFMRRAEFAQQLLEAPPLAHQPLHSETKEPLTFLDLRRRAVTPLAVDACWTALTGGAPYCSREEFARQLAQWVPERGCVCISCFERALVIGRATILLGYIVLFGLQVLVVGVFVVPMLQDSQLWLER